jgi:hypothetical protein
VCIVIYILRVSLQVFNLVGGMTLLLAPLAPGSPIPVRQVKLLLTHTLYFGSHRVSVLQQAVVLRTECSIRAVVRTGYM